MAPRRVKRRPRQLFLRHLKKLVAQQAASRDTVLAIDQKPEKLGPGEAKIYSFWTSGLEPGDHSITVKQHITAPENPPLDLKTTQEFEIIAPRFSLPDSDIHSTYPPQGHGDEPRVVPHIVFTDPHLPWERVGSLSASSTDKDWPRNRVPWLALWSFSEDQNGQNELHLSADDLNMFPASMKPVKPSSTYAVHMSMSDVWSMAPTVITPVSQDDHIEPVLGDTLVDMVFVPVDLFTSYVNSQGTSSSSSNGNTATNAKTPPDVTRYKYLAHVRHVNTTGMTESNDSDVEEHMFGVVVGHRAGPLTISRPTTVVVHLVSIENIEANIKLPINPTNPQDPPPTTRFVALPSLHSWSYQALPPEHLSVSDHFQHIGDTLNFLRSPDPPKSPVLPTPLQARVQARMAAGYALMRYRTQTGESTVALYRGPCTPMRVSDPLTSFIGGFGKMSYFGTDLQILDRQLGLMDISYSLAWQLGRTMAIGDQVFTSALLRLRSTIHGAALNAAKKEYLADRYRGKGNLFSSLKGTISRVEELAQGNSSADLQSRWDRPHAELPDLSLGNPDIYQLFQKHTIRQARLRAAAITTETASDGLPVLYDETNVPSSPDWAVVLDWVLNKTYLESIPAHYLIPDPSFLSRESLKFFFVDPNWIHAYLDGALSVGNHLEQNADSVRAAIKTTIAQYFADAYPTLGILPQIPTFGFLMRSVLVTQFPDLVVTAEDPEENQISILRQDNLAKDTLLCLFRREPSADGFQTLTVSQPPHQQYFALAATLDDSHIELRYSKVYAPTEPYPPAKDRNQESGPPNSYNKPSPLFDWNTRMLGVEDFALNIFTNIKTFMKGAYTDDLPSAALCAMQMNEPMYQFVTATTAPTSTGVPVTASNALTTRSTTATLGSNCCETALALRRETAPAARPNVGGGLAPHVRSQRIPAYLKRPQATPTSHAPIAPPQRQFDLHVYPLMDYMNPIPTDKGVAIDLVFSIRRRTDFTSSLQVYQLIFHIPVQTSTATSGTSSAQPLDKPVLTQKPEQVSATMLSNLRFNVHVGTTTENANLEIVVAPRSTTGYSKVSGSKEVSFILNNVEILPYTSKQKLYITGHEFYSGYPELDISAPVILQPSTA